MFIFTITNILSKVISTVFAIYVVRLLSASDYGIFSLSLSYLAVGVALSDLGLHQVYTREVNRRKGTLLPLTSTFLVIRFSLLMLFYLILMAVTDIEQVFIMLIICGTGFLFVSISTSYLISKELIKKVSLFKAINVVFLMFSLAATYFYNNSLSVTEVVMLYSFPYLLTGTFSLVYVILCECRVGAWRWFFERDIFKGVFFFCGSLIIFSVQPVFGILASEKISGLEYSAAYSLSYRFVSISLMVMLIISQLHMSKLYKLGGDLNKINNETKKQIYLNLALNLTFLISIFYTFDYISDFLLEGKEDSYMSMVKTNFQIICAIVIFSAISIPLGQRMLALDKQSSRFKFQLISFFTLVLSILVFNYFNVFYYASVSMVLAEAMLLILYYIGSKNEKNIVS